MYIHNIHKVGPLFLVHLKLLTITCSTFTTAVLYIE